MGWNSWNTFACDIDEYLIRETADAMASNGMKEAGYEYINIDDCWQTTRDENGKILVDVERFPNGMKTLADYVHSRGLKIGIYSSAGTETCEHRAASLGFEMEDAQTYADWGIDYLKYDFCYTRDNIRNMSEETLEVLTNGEVIAVNQDPLGIQGKTNSEKRLQGSLGQTA